MKSHPQESIGYRQAGYKNGSILYLTYRCTIGKKRRITSFINLIEQERWIAMQFYLMQYNKYVMSAWLLMNQYSEILSHNYVDDFDDNSKQFIYNMSTMMVQWEKSQRREFIINHQKKDNLIDGTKQKLQGTLMLVVSWWIRRNVVVEVDDFQNKDYGKEQLKIKVHGLKFQWIPHIKWVRLSRNFLLIMKNFNIQSSIKPINAR
jgi:hypothetical protein